MSTEHAAPVSIEARAFPFKEPKGKQLAFASITINDAFAMLPFFFFAMYEKDEQAAEKILRNIVRAKWFPARRPYRTENLYQYLETEGKALAGSESTTGAAAKKAVATHSAGAKR